MYEMTIDTINIVKLYFLLYYNHNNNNNNDNKNNINNNNNNNNNNNLMLQSKEHVHDLEIWEVLTIYWADIFTLKEGRGVVHAGVHAVLDQAATITDPASVSMVRHCQADTITIPAVLPPPPPQFRLNFNSTIAISGVCSADHLKNK